MYTFSYDWRNNAYFTSDAISIVFYIINIVYVTASVSNTSKLNLYPSGSWRFEISETWTEGAAEMKENYISRKLIRQRQNVKDLPLGY